MSVFTACQYHNCTSRTGIIFNNADAIELIFIYEPERVDPKTFHPTPYKIDIYSDKTKTIETNVISGIGASDLTKDTIRVTDISIKNTPPLKNERYFRNKAGQALTRRKSLP